MLRAAGFAIQLSHVNSVLPLRGQRLKQLFQEADFKEYVVTIDVARGFFAVAVMIYHELYFNAIVQIERIAYYAVYGFFVISGFSLFVAYRTRLNDIHDIRAFFVRRFFRLAPLYWTVLALRLIVQRWPDDMLYRMILNLTLTFGLVNAGSTALNGGGWSIGIEMVLYAFFPIVMIATRRSFISLTMLALCSLYVTHRFANISLAGHMSMAEPLVWERYTQPAAVVGYFCFGIFLGATVFRFPSLKGNVVLSLGLIVLGLVPFILLRTNTTLELLTGPKGLILMTSTLLIVSGAAIFPEPQGFARAAAIWLGALSYPIYLVHPVGDQFLKHFVGPGWPNFVGVIILSLVGSIAVHVYVERPFREYGRRIAGGKTNRITPN